MVYMHVEINCHMGKVPQFVEAFSKRIPVLESHGWKFVGGWHNTFGKVARIIHLWMLPDANSFREVLNKASQHPDFAAAGPAINDAVESEYISIMEHSDYGKTPLV